MNQSTMYILHSISRMLPRNPPCTPSPPPPISGFTTKLAMRLGHLPLDNLVLSIHKYIHYYMYPATQHHTTTTTSGYLGSHHSFCPRHLPIAAMDTALSLPDVVEYCSGRLYHRLHQTSGLPADKKTCLIHNSDHVPKCRTG